MQSQREFYNEFIQQALKENGYIIPTHEDDIDDFLEAIKNHDIPPLPENLNDPGSILDAPQKTETKIYLNHKASNTETRQFAMAAREGKQISNATYEKMKRHLASAKKKKN